MKKFFPIRRPGFCNDFPRLACMGDNAAAVGNKQARRRRKSFIGKLGRACNPPRTGVVSTR